MDTSNPVPVIFVDGGDLITGSSEGAEQLLGWSEPEIVGKPLVSIWNADKAVFLRKDGTSIEIVITRIPVPGGQTAVALRRPELMALREKLDLTLSHSEIVGSWDWNTTTDKVMTDKRLAETFGLAPGSSEAGLPLKDFVLAIHGDDRDRVSQDIERTLKTGEPFRSEYRLPQSDGSTRDVFARGRLVPGDGTRPTRFPGVLFDVTGRRAAERSAKSMERRYRSLFESIDAGFCVIKMIWDENGNPMDYEFIETNSAFETQTGIADGVGRRMREIAPTQEQHWFDLYGKVAQSQEAIQFENPAEALGRWYEVHAFPIDEPDSGHVAILFMDKSAQRKVAGALRKSEGNFRSLSQAMLNMVWTADEDGNATWFNERAMEYTGLSPEILLKEGLRSVVHPDDVADTAAIWRNARETNSVFQTECRLRRTDGTWRWHLVRAVPIDEEDGRDMRWIGTNTDIEHSKRNAAALGDLNATLELRIEERTAELLQSQKLLQQSQKMETLGQLTGGVAHDFNNLLQVIGGNLQLLARDVAGDERAGKRVANALSGVNRGAKLASQLLAFGRRQALEPRVVNLGKFLGGMDDLLHRSLGDAVEIEVASSGGLWNTHVDPSQFENAVLNLAINARDAMQGTGKLTIEVGNAFLERDYTDRHDDVEPGQYVMVAVSDTGSGMSPETMEKVFEPFYSTKPEGQGTGLGLSMVYGFVKQSGGHVKLYSELGHGTTVKIYLPRSRASEDRKVEIYDGPIVGGSETVLVVEDDNEVRDTAVEILRDLGYKILTARDAQAGLNIVESGVAIDVLFTDVVMPGMLKSREMSRQAKERLPNLVVLFTSGYTENSIVHGGKLDPGVELLSKPYTREALAKRLRHLLSNRQQVAQAVERTASPKPVEKPSQQDGKHILLVEDEALIRLTTADMLTELGHTVLEAGNAADALEAIASNEIDILVTDVGLPDLPGGELALRARAIWPLLPIIFATGESRMPIELEGSYLLSKPYDEDSLVAALRKALDH